MPQSCAEKGRDSGEGAPLFKLSGLDAHRLRHAQSYYESVPAIRRNAVLSTIVIPAIVTVTGAVPTKVMKPVASAGDPAGDPANDPAVDSQGAEIEIIVERPATASMLPTTGTLSTWIGTLKSSEPEVKS